MGKHCKETESFRDTPPSSHKAGRPDLKDQEHSSLQKSVRRVFACSEVSVMANSGSSVEAHGEQEKESCFQFLNDSIKC